MPQADKNVTISLEEAVRLTIIQEEAILRLLVRKGILTKEEILEEVRAVQRGMEPESAPGRKS